MAAKKLTPLNDGWYAWAPQPAVKVQVRHGPDGRVRLAALQVDAPLSAEVLRSIPLGRIEATANAELHASAAASSRAPARIAPGLRSNAVQGYPDAFYDAVA